MGPRAGRGLKAGRQRHSSAENGGCCNIALSFIGLSCAQTGLAVSACRRFAIADAQLGNLPHTHRFLLQDTQRQEQAKRTNPGLLTGDGRGFVRVLG